MLEIGAKLMIKKFSSLD